MSAKSRLRLVQRLFFLFVFAIAGMAMVSDGYAASKRVYAGIVIDAKSGKTLYAHAADSTRYPASVTKVMTLYVLFEELAAGRVKLSTKFRVSKHAAAAVPTKLGLRAGSTIRVEDAIKSLVTLSANDIARVIAENISGTESKFAVRMTRTAKALGMNRTTYRNASGLPDSRQITTARDQARLGVAIYQHFPDYYKYFQTRSFKYGKRTYGNHNRLLGRNGVDGIKTGYIRASGYNLLTAARSNNRHIVVVGFGFSSGAKRNSKVASLVSTYLPKARRGSYVQQALIAKPGGGRGTASRMVASGPVAPMPRLVRAPTSITMVAAAPLPVATPAPTIDLAPPPAQTLTALIAPEPQPRPIQLLPVTAADATAQVAQSSTASPVPLPKPTNIVGAWTNQTLRLSSDGVIRPPEAIGNDVAAIDLMTSGSIGSTNSTPAWVLQVGATPSEGGAKKLIALAANTHTDLSGFRSFIEPAKKNGQVFYRARFAGFENREQVQQVCAKLQEKNVSCLAMQS